MSIWTDVIKAHPKIFLWTFVLPGLLVFAILAYLGHVTAGLLNPQFNPLSYPGERVAETSVSVGQPVHLSVTRCNKTDKAVEYHTVTEWISVAPKGIVVPTGVSAVLAPPGCVYSANIETSMPTGVISKTQELLAQGLGSVTWRISHVSTPEGQPNAVTVSWTTTPIVVTR